MIVAKVGVMAFEDGGRGHEPRNAGAPKGWKDKEMDSPLELPEGSPANTMILALRLILDF